MSNKSIPSWFEEGICEYIAFGEEVNKKLQELKKEQEIIPFEKMKRRYRLSLLEIDSNHPENNIAYQQSASLVGHIINKFGFKMILNILNSKEKKFYNSLKKETGLDFPKLVKEWENEIF